MNFHNEVTFSNKNKSARSQEELLIKLLIAIRKDIGLSARDKISTFNFHLMGSAPKDNKEK
jgi:hypothetical protein